jgi:hypothetical protein
MEMEKKRQKKVVTFDHPKCLIRYVQVKLNEEIVERA